MKTTLVLKDDLVRKAKSRAALRGCTFSKYMELCLEKSFIEEACSVKDWLDELPEVSSLALREVDAVLDSAGFEKIDPEMWT